jgi:hypothetical protein
MQETFPALDGQAETDPPSGRFETHVIHDVLTTVGQMRPSVDIAVQ